MFGLSIMEGVRNMHSGKLRALQLRLYLICVLADFSAFVVIFAVSRWLAESKVEPWYLGVVGGCLSISAGVGSILGGWLPRRFGSKLVFLSGAAALIVSVIICSVFAAAAPGDAQPNSLGGLFLAGYWLMGIALGLLYPPLVGWLNQGQDALVNSRGVSRTLILYCVAWNCGMMIGQLSGGTLFAWGANWCFGVAALTAVCNLLIAINTVHYVEPLSIAKTAAPILDVSKSELANRFKHLGWLANLGGMFGGSMIIHLMPDLAVKIGIPPGSHGGILASWRAAIILTYVLLHASTFWHYRFAAGLGSQVLAAVGLIIIAQSNSAMELLLGLTLLGQLVGFNYFSGLFYSTSGSPHEGRALAAGIHEATLATGMAIGTMLGGLLGSNIDHRSPYLLAAGVLVLSMLSQIVYWFHWIRPLRRPQANYTPLGLE